MHPKCLTLDFGSGHDIMVCKFKPCIGLSAVNAEPTLDPLSPFLSAPPLPCSCSLSPKQINIKRKKNEILQFTMTWMELVCIMLSEISRPEKDKYSLTFHSYVDKTDEHMGRGRNREGNKS